MGMFDWYQPSEQLRCPVDGQPLREWQGKDGPCALFLWQQGVPHPVDQRADWEVRLPATEWEHWTLPATFTIYSFDCLLHQPIAATCVTRNGIWSSTNIRQPATQSGAESEGAATTRELADSDGPPSTRRLSL